MSSYLKRTRLVVSEMGSLTAPLEKAGQDRGSAALWGPGRKCHVCKRFGRTSSLWVPSVLWAQPGCSLASCSLLSWPFLDISCLCLVVLQSFKRRDPETICSEVLGETGAERGEETWSRPWGRGIRMDP